MTDQLTDPVAPAPAQPDYVDTAPPAVNRRKQLLTRLALIIAIIAVGYGGYYYVTQRGMVHTENAYVDAESAQVTPLVAGAVREIRVSDTQTVKRGDVLLVIDDADARVEFAMAEAALRQARQRFLQANATGSSLGARVEAGAADMAQARARLAAMQAEFERVRSAAARRQSLAGTGAVSREEVASADAELAAARANLDLARAGLSAASANRQSAAGQLAANQVITRGSIDSDPDVAVALARLDAARLGLDRTTIRAPIDGVVTQRQVQVGQRVAPGAPVMLIVPTGTAYVEANLKEAQLRGVAIGQPVELTSDLYGRDVVFHGRVTGIGGGTGAAFSIIPAQNATGNWVKVVQRVPVRIAIEPADLADHPLRIGLSMEATINTRGE